ncbi:hypothetical protein D7193_05040 [Micromonospora costi]|uniref:Uncharacterized protein n=1 Tax=Micromonospora costi TaxID=1530042 RepID=A0A3B0AC18_9ACTN|nr:hypothetical protein D7193_05040 [Micromonospora costi]
MWGSRAATGRTGPRTSPRRADPASRRPVRARFTGEARRRGGGVPVRAAGRRPGPGSCRCGSGCGHAPSGCAARWPPAPCWSCSSRRTAAGWT